MGGRNRPYIVEVYRPDLKHWKRIKTFTSITQALLLSSSLRVERERVRILLKMSDTKFTQVWPSEKVEVPEISRNSMNNRERLRSLVQTG